MAAEIEAGSQVDAVTVYPERRHCDPADPSRSARGRFDADGSRFPLTLDPSSLRVEGEAAPAW